MNTKFSTILLALAFGVVTLSAQNSDPDIMTINGKGIKKSEFEYVYNKNSQQQIEHKTLEEYLQMFKEYKLKVMEAEANGIDTTSAFLSELQGYRKQLAQPYLIDTEVDETLAKEAYARLQENVEVAHILFMIEENNPSKTKEKAYEKAIALKKRLDAGEDFTKLARECSEDPSVSRNDGYLGYIKGFMTVYPFEQAAYTTEVGNITEPVLSRFGYHIIKVMSRRADPGEVLPAHIMVMIPKGATESELKAKEEKIREAYQKLQEGATFEEVVEQYTEDPSTRDTEGKMRWVSTGRTIKEFEDVIFALGKGEISEPFKTPFGWHIAKVVDKRGLQSYEEMHKEIMRRISRDERAGSGRKSLIAKLKVEYNYNFNGDKMSQLKETLKSSATDSLFANIISTDNATLFTLDGVAYSVADFAEYYSKHLTGKSETENSLTSKVDKYIDKAVIEYESSKLADKYPDFRNLYNEYRDGMLLFEISNREVWDKAAQDTKGLKKFFKKNKNKYSWSEPRFKGVVVQCKNDSIAMEAEKRLQKLDYETSATTLNKEMNVGSERVLKAKRGLFEIGDNAVVDYSVFKTGKQVVDETFPVSFAKGKILKKRPESYLDVKGQVTADYQTKLEKDWVEYLNKKYEVVIDYDVVSTIKEK